MFATTLIVFREMLEAALIIGIVMAATRGAHHRGLWVGVGIGGGVLGALLIAASADVIANAVEGVGQEVLNATVLFMAVGMLGWHNIWMKRHSLTLVAQMNEVGRGRARVSVPSMCSPLWWALRCYVKARKWCCFFTVLRSVPRRGQRPSLAAHYSASVAVP